VNRILPFTSFSIPTSLRTIALLVLIFLVTINAHSQTKIIAHRGFSSAAPENTLTAFQKAIEIGAPYFELDVYRTKDDSIIVIHDATLKRTTSNNARGTIAEMNYANFKDVRVGYRKKFGDTFENEKVPTLREALQLAKGKIKVCIEIKVNEIEASVLKAVNDLKVNNEVIIFSFNYDVLKKIRALDKNIEILYLKGNANKTTLNEAQAINAQAIGVGGATKITKDFLDQSHSKGLEVWQYTINKEDRMQKLIDLGIDGLITDYPDKALEILRKTKN
jgi:glycerophosphoryl diester phosphodiesterase